MSARPRASQINKRPGAYSKHYDMCGCGRSVVGSSVCPSVGLTDIYKVQVQIGKVEICKRNLTY